MAAIRPLQTAIARANHHHHLRSPTCIFSGFPTTSEVLEAALGQPKQTFNQFISKSKHHHRNTGSTV
jgi:hypothetical protein